MLQYSVSELHVIDCALELKYNNCCAERYKCQRAVRKDGNSEEQRAILLKIIHRLNNKIAEIEGIRDQLKIAFDLKIQKTENTSNRKRSSKVSKSSEAIAASA